MPENFFRKVNAYLPTRESAAVFLSLVFVVGFLGARALLSISTLLLGLNALRGFSPKGWLRNRLWIISVLWVALYAVSYFWSADKGEWGERVQVKLPFLLFPLATAYPLRLSRRQNDILMSGTCLLLLSGIAFSLSFFARDAAEIIRKYGISFTFRTPAYNNHICFSAFLAATVFFIWAQWGKLSKGARWIAGISAVVMIGYLHLLAAKTGLAILYLAGLLLIARTLYQRRFRAFGGFVIVLAGVLGLAWTFMPTFRNRIIYSRWSFSEYNSGKIADNYSDPNRLYSYKVALRQIRESPLAGYGAGDVKSAMDSGYVRWFPQIALENRLVPHNQFLASGMAVGVGAMALLLLWWLLIPVQAWRLPRRFENVSIWFLASVLLFVDPAFEVQFGIAAFLFFIYWFRQLEISEYVR